MRELGSPLRNVGTAVLLLFLFVAVFGIYSEALPGRFLFDDTPFLSPLTSVVDAKSAAVFVISGDTGPLGRPLTAATFAAQASSYPDDPAAFLRVNFFIHLLSMVAAFLAALGLARLRLTPMDGRAPWIALAVAAIWGLSPFLATTHLMVVQRLTGLSGLFVFFGLSAFVWAHLVESRQPRLATALLVVGLGGGTVLATLAKENGALLPLLAMTILWLWIPADRRMSGRMNRIAVVLLAFIPGFVVAAYLVYLATGIFETGYGPIRDFTPVQRLLSQPTILLDYLRNLLVPSAAAVTPFMDQIPAPRGLLDPPITVGAVILWLCLLGLGVWLRQTAPHLLFGTGFFLTGHLIESSIVGLELYFAHRNYVPSFGVYFALVFALFSVPARFSALARGALTVYASLFAVVLWLSASTWRDTEVSAELWYLKNPHSERAAQYLAQAYVNRGKPAVARRILDEAADRNPRLALLQIQRTQICLGREDEFQDLLHTVTNNLRSAIYQPNAVTEIALAAKGDTGHLCAPRDLDALDKMAVALWENPVYVGSEYARAALLNAQAFISASRDDQDEAVERFLEALRLGGPLDNALFAASLLVNSGDFVQARMVLQEARSHAPEPPLAQRAWLQRIDSFESLLLKKL